MSAAFEFTSLATSVLSALEATSGDTLELLDKWGLSQNIKLESFSFNNHFQSYLKESFALDFLRNDAVTAMLRTCTAGASLSGEKVDQVSVEEVPCTVTNMSFFDRLWHCGVVRASGSIAKCLDEPCGDVMISDELRKILLLEESDHYSEFSEEERKEFLFRLFKHLQLGGRINQYEDDIRPYVETTKLMYKNLLTCGDPVPAHSLSLLSVFLLTLSVVKNSSTNELSIPQTVLEVKAKLEDETIFPHDHTHPQSFCYLIVDSIKRTVALFAHSWS